MFEDPFYDINYTWADVIALRLFSRANSDPNGFVAACAMARGFDVSSEAWLKRAFDIDLHDPHLVQQALQTLQPYVECVDVLTIVGDGTMAELRWKARTAPW